MYGRVSRSFLFRVLPYRSLFRHQRPVFLATYTPFTLFHIGCALAQNPQTLIICRFLAGAFGYVFSLLPVFTHSPVFFMVAPHR